MIFMIGVILSIHPASIIVGEHTQLSHLSRWTRWNGYLIFILTIFIVDVLITNGIYAAFYEIYGNLSVLRELTFDPMAIFFSESFQIGVVLVFGLVLLQVLGLVDLAHGERNLSGHIVHNDFYDRCDLVYSPCIHNRRGAYAVVTSQQMDSVEWVSYFYIDHIYRGCTHNKWHICCIL